MAIATANRRNRAGFRCTIGSGGVKVASKEVSSVSLGSLNFASSRSSVRKRVAFKSTVSQKAREGSGCPKLLAGKVFGQISTLLENSSPIFRQHEMLSLPRFGHFPARKTAAGKLAAPSGTLLDFFGRPLKST